MPNDKLKLFQMLAELLSGYFESQERPESLKLKLVIWSHFQGTAAQIFSLNNRNSAPLNTVNS